VASAALHCCLFGLGTFWFDDATSGSRRRIAIGALLALVRSLHAQTATAGPDGPRGASVTASTASHGGHCRHSGPDWSSTTDTTCIATGPKAGQQRATQTDVAARAAWGDHNFGRASERFVSEQLRRCERWRPGQLASRLSGERPPTGTEPVTAGAGSRPMVTAVTAPVTAPSAACTVPVTAITATESGQLAQFQRRRRAPGQRHSPGQAGGTKSTGEAKQTARAPNWSSPPAPLKTAGFVAPLVAPVAPARVATSEQRSAALPCLRSRSCSRDLAATLRSRLRSKMSQGTKCPLPGSSCHAAIGARIVPWRQPGDWAVNHPIASTARLRPDPDRDSRRRGSCEGRLHGCPARRDGRYRCRCWPHRPSRCRDRRGRSGRRDRNAMTAGPATP
jgi:hypothetical protein